MLASERHLAVEDLVSLPDDEKSAVIAQEFMAALDGAPGKQKLYDGLFSVFGWDYLVPPILCKLPHDALVFVGPVFLRLIIRFMLDESMKLLDGFLLVAGVWLAATLQSFCLQQYFHRVYGVGQRVMAALNGAIYAKALRLAAHERGKLTAGELVNLLSIDAERLKDLCPYFHNLLWSAWLQVRMH